MINEDAEPKTAAISFFQKNAINCPVCDASIYREELLTGRGRLIAGNLTKELRRLYEESKKFGEVSPLVYPVTVCPDCYYASWKEDFSRLPPESVNRLKEDQDQRVETVGSLLGHTNFTNPRTLKEGLASYYLSIRCYDHFTKEFSPVIKQAISCLRAAWLCNDLERTFPGENYGYLGRIFYRKARYFYNIALEYEQKGVQTVSGCPNLGPDIDKNYSYDGMIYLCGYLEYHFGPRKNEEKRQEALLRAKRSVARIFGMGKASRNKPLPLLENAKDLYNEISTALGQKNANPEEDAKAGD
jgi:uncharacterized protein (DUF2225 family)